MQWYNAFSLKIKIKKIKIENLSFYCYPYTSNKYAKITQTGVNLSRQHKCCHENRAKV